MLLESNGPRQCENMNHAFARLMRYPHLASCNEVYQPNVEFTYSWIKRIMNSPSKHPNTPWALFRLQLSSTTPPSLVNYVSLSGV